jgi:predicted enzyme related to lactoylglutathione lyase
MASMFKNVNVVYHYVTDWAGGKKFWGDLLEWPVAYESDEAGWMEWGMDNMTHVAINKWDEPGPAPIGRGGTLTLTVEDVYKTSEALKKRGIKVDDVLHIPNIVLIGTGYDPEGNRFQFVQEGAPPA